MPPPHARGPRADAPPGVVTGPLAAHAMTAYTASSYIWLGEFELARQHAESAVVAHERTPANMRSPSREAIAQLDLGIALACLGAPEEAAALGVTALNSPRVVASVRARAKDLGNVLTSRYAGRSEVEEFHVRLGAA